MRLSAGQNDSIFVGGWEDEPLGVLTGTCDGADDDSFVRFGVGLIVRRGP